MEKKANIRFHSNVYPVSTENVANDPDFRKQVRGKNALRKLVACIYGPMSRDEQFEEHLFKMDLEEWQLRLYWGHDLHCAKYYEYKEEEKPYGLVIKNEVPSIVCRCNRKNCTEYTRCRPGS